MRAPDIQSLGLPNALRQGQSGVAMSYARTLSMLTKTFRHPQLFIWAGAAAMATVILGSSAVLLENLRKDTLRAAEAELSRFSLTLAEQADRSFKSLDLVISSIAENIVRRDATSLADFSRSVGGHDTHQLLKEKLSGLPQVDAITVINKNGKLINFSRYWPIPEVNVSDRDYFKALSSNPSMDTFVSSPVQNRGTGTWTIYIARRLNDRNGSFLGLVLGAMTLQYFEEFYQSVSRGSGSAISLMRNDGMMLARHPHTDDVGKVFEGTREMLTKMGARAFRDVSPIDGRIRIKAASRLENYPLLILTTQVEQSLLVSWRSISWVVAAFAFGISALLLIAAHLVTTWWRQIETAIKLDQDRSRAETARAEAEATLSRLRERAADAASEAKSSFVAVMSHEIRTPLNAIIGLTNAMLETELTSNQRDLLKTMQLSGDGLMGLLNDVLDYSKLEANQMKFESIPFSPTEIVDATMSIIGARAHAKGLVLKTDYDPDLPVALLGDPGRIRQILLNLASNAVKFTQSGSITFIVRRTRASGADATIEWSVSDTGIGVAADKIGSLFQDFVQADTSVNRRFGGSGLGLSICKKMVDKLSGTIEVDSTLGLGTKVRVLLTLPVADTITSEPEGHREDSPLPEVLKDLSRPLRVLIADDNSTNRLVAAKMLESTGAHISMATDGMEAVAASRRFLFDVILMDIRMPEMDGIEATKIIRLDGNPVPILAVTANVFCDDHAVFMRSGMQGVVAKPVRKSSLLNAIGVAIMNERSRKRCVDNHTASELGGGITDVVYVSEEQHTRLSSEIGEEVVAEAVGIFFDDAAQRLGYLRHSDVTKDREAIRLHMHSIKGSSAYLGFDIVSTLAQAIEAGVHSLTQNEYELMREKIDDALVVTRDVLGAKIRKSSNSAGLAA